MNQKLVATDANVLFVENISMKLADNTDRTLVLWNYQICVRCYFNPREIYHQSDVASKLKLCTVTRFCGEKHKTPMKLNDSFRSVN